MPSVQHVFQMYLKYIWTLNGWHLVYKNSVYNKQLTFLKFFFISFHLFKSLFTCQCYWSVASFRHFLSTLTHYSISCTSLLWTGYLIVSMMDQSWPMCVGSASRGLHRGTCNRLKTQKLNWETIVIFITGSTRTRVLKEGPPRHILINMGDLKWLKTINFWHLLLWSVNVYGIQYIDTRMHCPLIFLTSVGRSTLYNIPLGQGNPG